MDFPLEAEDDEDDDDGEVTMAAAGRVPFFFGKRRGKANMKNDDKKIVVDTAIIPAQHIQMFKSSIKRCVSDFT